MILMIDNYDSFVYNLVQYFGELGEKIVVYRNDKLTIKRAEKLKFDRIVISPGPKRPEDAGISCEIIERFKDKVPILGVCLGHQCIGYVFGGKITYAKKLMHGKTSLIYHNQKEIFQDIENPFVATRYHSLVIERETLPDCLEITAWTDDQEIMGIRHKEYKIFGVQFHPESILTKEGKKILKNFLHIK
ncbi:MAG: aminodeoxychorismate/anthranilate synthase component II [Candidatus Omnitrophica bacterium]|nr:aminodeoxychorismate/anthranilate synthase component II [Candidatus Omnitrophota bacterium]